MSSIYWLLSDDALQQRQVREIREARTPLGALAPKAAARAVAPELPAPLSIANGVATIRVEGVLTPAPDPVAEFYGEPNTTYLELQASLAAAMSDPSVREVVWAIDSPGGSVDGYHSLIADIADARAVKPMRVSADNAQSAAYGIAAAVGQITATSRTASFGSVGVAVSAFVPGALLGKVVDITNSASPDKRPNVETPEGVAVVQAYLDQMAAEFMGGIAQGRGVSASTVAERYGRGASMLAPMALETGLIDRIAARAVKRPAYAALDRTPAVGYGPAGMAEPATVAPVEAEPEAPAPTEPPAGDPPVESEPEAPAPTEPPAGDPPAAHSISAAELAEFTALRAERDARAGAERTTLVGALVALRAETPGTAYANGALVARLAAEPLADLRARVAALRAQTPAQPAAAHTPPPVGAATDGGLNDSQRAEAAKIKDPAVRARFISLCEQQNAQRQGNA